MRGHIVIAPTVESVSTALACMACGDQRKYALNRAQLDELSLRGELRLYCPVCRAGTSWSGAETDRRSGRDRRGSPHPRLALPIRLRCDLHALYYTEVTTTLTASRKGASLMTSHSLRRGMPVAVVMPYTETDPNPLETPARVACVEAKDDGWEVGIELIR
jgi:hypothetical protein